MTDTETPVVTLRGLLRAHLDSLDGPVVFAIEADKFLRNTDRQIIDQWVEEHLHRIVTAELRLVAAIGRRSMRRTSKLDRFRTATAEGDLEALQSFASVFDNLYPVNDESEQVRLGEMYKKELLGAAEYYGNEAAPALMEKAFFEAVARDKRLGDRKVSEAFTEEQILELRRSLTF